MSPPGAQDRRVLIVDDEAMLARAIGKRLAQLGYECRIAGTLADARGGLNGNGRTPDLVLLDMRLPDGNGLELFSALGGSPREGPAVVVLTAFGEVETAVQAMKLGAADYLRKPVDLDELALVVERVMRSVDLRHRLDYSRERDSHAAEGGVLLGESAPMRAARDQIAAIAAVLAEQRTTPPPVLILGETGTGKDVAARLLHARGVGPGRPFVHVDCASLPRELMEAELFGHARGAFAGAHDSRAGLIEAAESGTVFLDEIGELPPDLQTKLLNVLDRRRIRRIGTARETAVEASFVAATNRPLPEMVAEGAFRSDLYYRLNVLVVHMPPLRDCAEDVPALARHFAEATARRYGRPAPRLTEVALAAMTRYDWPGNVRELEHLVERAVLLSRSGEIGAAALALRPSVPPPADAAPSAPPLAGLTLEAAERWLIEDALRRTGGNVSEAARRLGITRMAMRYRIDKHGIKPSAGGGFGG